MHKCAKCNAALLEPVGVMTSEQLVGDVYKCVSCGEWNYVSRLSGVHHLPAHPSAYEDWEYKPHED